MSERGISNLLTTIMAAGGVRRLDARDHRQAHAALRRLLESEDGRAVLSAFDVNMDWRPDPEVGIRVPGVTKALWEAVGDGGLVVDEDGVSAEFVLADHRTASLRRELSRLPAGFASAIHRTGTAWAADSTSRKNVARAALSPAATRRVRRA